jgi:hypothetical protein
MLHQTSTSMLSVVLSEYPLDPQHGAGGSAAWPAAFGAAPPFAFSMAVLNALRELLMAKSMAFVAALSTERSVEKAPEAFRLPLVQSNNARTTRLTATRNTKARMMTAPVSSPHGGNGQREQRLTKPRRIRRWADITG